MYVVYAVLAADDINQRCFQELCIQYETLCQQCLGKVDSLKVFVCLFSV